MSSTWFYLTLSLASGIVGLALGILAYWLLSGRRQMRALKTLEQKCQQLEMELLEEQKNHEATLEKTKWLEKAEDKLREAFQALASQSLQANADDLLKRSKTELEHLVKPLDRDLERLDSQVRELEQKREGAYQGLQEHLRQLDEAQKALQTSTLGLNQALRSSTARGSWGELQLRRVVELAGMLEHVDFEEQASGTAGRPDMIVSLPNGGILPVDAKAPMQAYIDAVAATEDKARSGKLQDHVRAVRGRVRELSQKQYWAQFDQVPPFVVMFIPNEACLSAAFQKDGSLLDDAIRAQVLIASPVTLLALLKTVGYGWQQLVVAENARRIAEEGRILYQRISKLGEYLGDLGSSLDKSVEAYNRLLGSLEQRLLPSVRRFEELGLEAEQMSPPQILDHTVRSLSAPELVDS